MTDLMRRKWIVTGAIAALGAVGGVLAAVFLTYTIKALVGARPAHLEEYVWNAKMFAAFGFIGAPALAWATLRDVPIWRAVVEPAVVAIAVSVLTVMLAPSLFALLVPASVVISAMRLGSKYHKRAGIGSVATTADQHAISAKS